MNTTAFWQKLLLGLALLALIGFGLSVPAAAETDDKDGAQGGGKFSLTEAAPELFYAAMRYDKFFGDANTVDGGIFERSQLIGDPGGVRQKFVDHGLYMNVGVTQFLQRNTHGGDNKNTRFNGSTDLWMWFDTGKADLWPGGAFFVHGEGRWRSGINNDVGSIQSANHDQNFPDTDSSNNNWALPEWYFIQSLPLNFMAAAGKMNFASYGDTNPLANRERTQFTYSGLVVNPIPGEYFPYTTLIGWLNWSPNKTHSLTGVCGINNGNATAETETFDTLTTKDLSYVFQYVATYNIARRPGSFLVDLAYSNRERKSFDISRERLFGQLIGAVAIDEKSSNYTLIGNFSQYLWVKEGSEGLTRHNLTPRGIGIFGRFGWHPEDRNVIDAFYSFGIRGTGVSIPGRNDDEWGIGWAGSHISGDLRDLTDELRSWEHAFEVYYNFMLTPAMHLSANSQVIRPAVEDNDTALTLGLRLQLDF
jgi:carbohydrate-selective porin OprB